jgi:hypothetical protein
MRQRNTHLVPLVAVTLAVALIATACGDSSPVTPNKEPLIFSGQLASRGFESHNLGLERSGTVSIELTELRSLFVRLDPINPIPLLIGVGIGAFNSNGVCVPTIRPTFTEGLKRSVLLGSAANCLSVFDQGTLPASSLVKYTVTVFDESSS